MSLFDRLLGRGGGAVTVPVMDGPFLPNQKLDAAAEVVALPDADNLVARAGALYASSAARLLRSEDGRSFAAVETFDFPISALASRDDALAIGLAGEGLVVRGGEFDGKTIGAHGEALRCVTALAWLNECELAVCSGSAAARPHEWRRSLMQLDASGVVVKVDLRDGSITPLSGAMAWPAGLAVAGETIYVAEAWRHRVAALPRVGGGRAETALGNLPGYPARIAAASAGGYWLSFYSARNQLVEFILQEPTYRSRMIAEVPEAYWMAPSLSSGRSAKEPMQGSQLKQMGVLKPYSASRSYGLVAYCDVDMNPLGSFHSRSGGRRHGVLAACERDGALFLASRGSGAILRIDDPMNALAE